MVSGGSLSRGVGFPVGRRCGVDAAGALTLSEVVVVVVVVVVVGTYNSKVDSACC